MESIALSRRERQIMDIVYRRGCATAAEVREELSDPPTYNAVRAALRLLVERGQLRHVVEGRRYVYLPTTPHHLAREQALRHLLGTFFGGNAGRLVGALLEGALLSPGELERIARDQAERSTNV